MHLNYLLSAAIAATAVFAQDDEDSSSNSLTSVLGDNDDLSSLATLLEDYPDLVETLSGSQNITILAPSNDALADFETDGLEDGFLEATLRYHVLNAMVMSDAINGTAQFVPSLLTADANDDYTTLDDGQVVEALLNDDDEVVFFGGFLSNVTVSEADIEFSGGVIHIVDGILRIPRDVDVVAVAGNLTAFAGALGQSDLLDDVADLDQVTIFAPNNAAFQAIGSAVSDIDDDTLASILQYHVVEDSVLYSTNITNSTTIQALDGTDLTITVDGGAVYVNGAQVIIPDLLVSNGVVHVIDQVLNPENPTTPGNGTAATGTESMTGTMTGTESMTGTETAAATTEDNAFSASSGTDVPFTSAAPTTVTEVFEVPPSEETTGADDVAAGGGAEETESESEDAAPMATAAVGMAALFGGAAFMANF
ncbi:hypothetical protein MBLNU230_g6517t1 [Neophaeotheca triangularis]